MTDSYLEDKMKYTSDTGITSSLEPILTNENDNLCVIAHLERPTQFMMFSSGHFEFTTIIAQRATTSEMAEAIRMVEVARAGGHPRALIAHVHTSTTVCEIIGVEDQITAAKTQAALAKLTDEEKELLGLELSQ